jgi:hypothetical protein
MVESRTPGSADDDGINVESLSRIGNGFGGVVRHGPDGDDFNLSFSNRLKRGFECLDTSLVRHMRGVAGEQSRPFFHVNAIQGSLAFAFGARYSFLNYRGLSSRSANKVEEEYNGLTSTASARVTNPLSSSSTQSSDAR